MIPITPHGTATVKRVVETSREADREAADPGAPRLRRVGFRNEMHVVVLDAEVQDAEAAARSGPQSRLDRRVRAGSP
jgi:hypothetical protein